MAYDGAIIDSTLESTRRRRRSSRRRVPLLLPVSVLLAIVAAVRLIRCIGNFKSVKRGKFDDYSIRKYQSNVVANDFKFGTDKNVVVALEQDVFMVNKKHLQKVRVCELALCRIFADIFNRKPTRESLSTPVKQLRSRSSIVNSPY